MSSGNAPDDTQMLKVFVGTLSRLFNPDLVRTSVIAAANEAGVADIEALLPEKVIPTKEKKGKKQKEGKPRKVRATVPYTLFVTKAMDRIAHDSSYAALTAPGPDGKAPHQMSITASLWRQLGAGPKECFMKAYQPLCDQLKTEREVSGIKVENLTARIREFEDKFDAKTKASLKDVLPENMPASKFAALTVALGASGTPTGEKRPADDISNGAQEEDDDDASSSDDSGSSGEDDDSGEDEGSDDAAAEEARKLEEARKAIEAQKEAEKKKREEKKAQKKAKGAEEGSAKKAEEGSTKKSKKK